MKKSEWIYLASAMWKYSEKNEGKISRLLKELVCKCNNNLEVIVDDDDKIFKTNGNDRGRKTKYATEDSQ
jgi:hypothetical protein|tara:strand:+ start:424 stop:633 length:210 start_codon:yes stop_codon:yes gene_type:complete